MKLNYLLLDPNDVARLQVRQRLKEIPELSLLNEFSNFNDLKSFLQHESTDLIIIDPSENEDKIFNFIEQNGIQNKVIFTSKKSKHAVKGFELGVLDFLQKPFTLNRFEVTIDRIRDNEIVSKPITRELKKNLEVKCNLKTEKISLSSIQWIEAMGDYIKIVTPQKKYIVLSSMKGIQERIPDNYFFRCHKSYIINTEEVANFSQNTIFLNNKSIPLSRSKRKVFREFWSSRY